MSIIKFGGLSIKLIIGVYPLSILEVVHKINYSSMSTIYIGGLSTYKTNIFVWKQFSYMALACVRESVRTRGMRLDM